MAQPKGRVNSFVKGKVMWGTIVNALAVLVGGTLGLLLKKGIPERFSDVTMKGLGLCVLYIGISGVLKGQNALIAIIAIVLGGIIGEMLDLDGKISRLGDKLQSRFAQTGGKSSIAQGFVTSSLLFCVGAMAIVGSLQSGLTGDHQTLYAKSLLDGISSIIFAATLGAGVLFSAGLLFLYQGAITLLAGLLAPMLGDAVIAEMTCVGSLLIIALSLNMLGVTKLKVINYVPGIFLPILLCLLM